MTFDPVPAFQAALAKIDGNFQVLTIPRGAKFNIHAVPGHLTNLGLRPGCNTGWTTSFCTGQLWLVYQWTQNEKYRRVARGTWPTSAPGANARSTSTTMTWASSARSRILPPCG